MNYKVMLGEKNKFYREKKNYTHEHVAREIGITTQTYCRYESGEIELKVDRLRRIAEVLDVPLEELLKIDPIVIHQHNNHQANGIVHHQHNLPKEFFDEFRSQVDARIDGLERLIEGLVKEKIS